MKINIYDDDMKPCSLWEYLDSLDIEEEQMTAWTAMEDGLELAWALDKWTTLGVLLVIFGGIGCALADFIKMVLGGAL